MNGFRSGIAKYAVFKGRSRRREFWEYHLGFLAVVLAIVVVFVIAAVLAESAVGASQVLGVVGIALSITILPVLIIPTLAMNWRRFQDVGAHGVFSLLGIPFPLLILAVGCFPGNPQENDFGPAPQG